MTARIKGNVLTVDGLRTRLMPQEVTILWAVMARRDIDYFKLAKILWPHPDFAPDFEISTIRVFISKLRKKLKPGGWELRKRSLKPLELVRID